MESQKYACFFFGLVHNLCRVSKHQNHRIPSKEHFADEAVLIDRLLILACWQLGPHLLDILKNHVAVAVKGLYTSEKLLIIAEGDEDLGMIADRLLEDREGIR